MILNITLIYDWESIRKLEQYLIDKTKKVKNTKPINCRVYEKYLLRDGKLNKCKELYKIPYPIITVFLNGTVTIRWGSTQEHINIR